LDPKEVIADQLGNRRQHIVAVVCPQSCERSITLPVNGLPGSYSSKADRTITSGLPTIRPETALYGTSDQQICVATKIGFWLV
jgi:hypothetical protein